MRMEPGTDDAGLVSLEDGWSVWLVAQSGDGTGEWCRRLRCWAGQCPQCSLLWSVFEAGHCPHTDCGEVCCQNG